MSVIFNNTFTADKPIYYPANWGTGQNATEYYEQFKSTFTYVFARNAAEVIIAGLWILVLFAVVVGLKQLYRLAKLADDNMEKVQNRKYLKSDTLMSICFLGVAVTGITAGLLCSVDGRSALLKGLITFCLFYILRTKLSTIYRYLHRTPINSPSSKNMRDLKS